VLGTKRKETLQVGVEGVPKGMLTKHISSPAVTENEFVVSDTVVCEAPVIVPLNACLTKVPPTFFSMPK